MTNVLVEGGGRLLGSLFDAGFVDEVHAFVAAKLLGGTAAATPIGGRGIDQMTQARLLDEPEIECVGSDVYIHGRVRQETDAGEEQPRAIPASSAGPH
jgi:diaminohydroxyphosphoribosylaminopyrimidine deaminase/5-amino-6-(5-phosphoribosylamino)uracil reductase